MTKSKGALALGLVIVVVAALLAIFNQSRRLVAEPAAELDVILPSDLELQ